MYISIIFLIDIICKSRPIYLEFLLTWTIVLFMSTNPGHGLTCQGPSRMNNILQHKLYG